MTIDPKLLGAIKEAVKLVGEVGERDTQAIVDELQVNRPDLFESLAAAHGSGEHVEGMFHLALIAALDRKDLDDNAKDELRAGAEVFLALVEIFREAPGLSRLREAIFEFAGIALLTGLQAGRSPVEVDRHHSKLSQGGKTSAAGREARWPWRHHAEELAKEVCDRDRTLSPGKVADAIGRAWKLADLECPGHKSLEMFVSKLRESGSLPRREAPQPQRRKRPQRISWK